MNQEVKSVARIDVIDGLRGFAIISVIYGHLYLYRFWNPGWHGFWLFGMRFSPFTIPADLIDGVPLFFILSGFVLYLPYAMGLRSMTTVKDALLFYKRRGRRLLPLYYFNIFFVLAFATPPQPPSVTLRQLFYLSTFLFPFTINLRIGVLPNLPLWSLGAEFWFCLLMPLIVFACRKYGIRTVLLSFMALSLGTRFYHVLTVELNGMDFLAFQLMNTVPARLFDFVVGMVIADQYLKYKDLPRSRLWLAAGAFFIVFSTVFREVIWQEQAPFPLAVIDNLLTVTGLGLFSFGILFTRLPLFKFIFSNWPICLIGMMSYSLFIWHYPAISILRPDLSFLRLSRYILLILVFSFLSYRYIEFGWVRDLKSLLPRYKSQPEGREHIGKVSR